MRVEASLAAGPETGLEANHPARVHGLVLAAGMAQRMGVRKQLLDLGGAPMLRRTVSALVASDVSTVTVVLPPALEALEPGVAVLSDSPGADMPVALGTVWTALAGLPVQTARNEYPERGLLSSLKTGLVALASKLDENDGVMVVLADQPLVGTVDYDRLIGAFHERRGDALVCPTFAGRRGNPVIIPRAMLGAVMARQDMDRGAAFLFAEFPDQVCEVQMESDAVHEDCDTPADYMRLQARFAVTGLGA